MILRKPYALLIQYFQRIHLILIVLSAYIFYKVLALRTFVADFLNTESYNAYYEPISDYINIFLLISVFLVVVISIVLIILLHYKKKPWKIYLLPVIEYVFMFGVLVFIRSYFNSYDEFSTITPIMAGRDLLNIVSLPQYIVFIIFGIRLLGIDLKKFGFKDDEEYLDIKEEDREEFEVNIEFDKDKVTRTFKKFIRNVKYVYFEHQLICNTIIIILFVSLTGYTYYYFGVLHRTYKEGNTFSANYYDITVNNSYLTTRDSKGFSIVSNDNTAYLVLNLTVKNNASRREINIDRFRVMNKSEQFNHVGRLYDNFKDLGSSYSPLKKLDTGEETTFILVYKVDAALDPSKYVLYYHDLANNLLLKKTKLSVQDVRDVKTVNTVNLNEKMTFEDKNTLTITNATIGSDTTYNKYGCDSYGCGIRTETFSLSKNKILTISFISNKFTGQSFIDFSNIYAKIRYEDNNGKIKRIETTSLISDYNGNYAYFGIPSDISSDSNVDLIFTFRNKRYVYHLI